MNKIICLLKFGEKEHMEGLTRGEMYFSNALNFRQIEEKELIKGQGDKLEGGSLIQAQDVTMIDNESNDIVFSGFRGSFHVHYEPANLFPVYCLFACYKKDCTLYDDGTLEFHFSEEIKDNIKQHFPKADSVAIIKNPDEFIANVKATIGTKSVSGLVNYFNLYGLDSAEGKANDLQYIKYLTQDIPPQKVEGGLKCSFSEKYVYRSLLCKDVFFKNEQEYRFILPNDKISKGTIYSIKPEQIISVVDLKEFFG
ncbi:hypothetical protein [uncultured Eubacterium sp.]|uniref:hypothetical protein n=1 Tax=uncultured Eubacterium sp. TaxID=165185 RepID=UPI0025DEC437|nr:hypothetical protein [uncultured Eubacterium sp.]